jgi:hypothetical protein
MISDARVDISALTHQGMSGQAAARAALSYLDYLTATWMHESLWLSWSQKGRAVASVILKVPIEGVLPTTNHLESFNGLLKRKYIPRWQHSGIRLRFDFLIRILITEILPDVYASRLSSRNYRTWLVNRFADHAGGVNLVELRKSQTLQVQHAAQHASLCWWEVDQRRDSEALGIFQLRRLHNIRQSVSSDQFEAMCISASVTLDSTMPKQYELRLRRGGFGHCNCPDFSHRGGACKHLRALHLVIESWVQQNIIAPFYYPSTAPSIDSLLLNSLIPENHLAPSQTMLQSEQPPGTTAHSSSVLDNVLALQRLAGDDVEPSEITDSDSVNSDIQFGSGVSSGSVTSMDGQVESGITVCG